MLLCKNGRKKGPQKFSLNILSRKFNESSIHAAYFLLYFPQNAVYITIFAFSHSNNMFFTNHVSKFKCQFNSYIGWCNTNSYKQPYLEQQLFIEFVVNPSVQCLQLSISITIQIP